MMNDDNAILNINCNIKNNLNNDIKIDINDHELSLMRDNDTFKNIIENNKCDHEWVTDLIDIDPDRSQYICYCCKCELTK